MIMTTTQETLETLTEPVCAAHGVELVQIRQIQGRGALRVLVVIDRERGDGRDGSGVTLDDCKRVSRDLSTALDVHEDVIPGKFHLEVSSPGLDRPLVKLRDFERFAGREAKLKTHDRVVGDRRNFTGILRGVDDGQVSIEVDAETFHIPYEAIARANLVPKL